MDFTLPLVCRLTVFSSCLEECFLRVSRFSLSFALLLDSTRSFSRDFSRDLSFNFSGFVLFDLLGPALTVLDLLRSARSFKGFEAARFKVYECLPGDCLDLRRDLACSELSEDDGDLCFCFDFVGVCLEGVRFPTGFSVEERL